MNKLKMNSVFIPSNIIVLAVFAIVLAFTPVFSYTAPAAINDVQGVLETGEVTSAEAVQTTASDSVAAAKKADKYELAIITDLHVNVKDYDAKEKVLKILNGWSNIDAVAILGDISQQIASPAEFERSKKFLEGLHHKKYCITGNHDYIYEDKLNDDGKKERASASVKKAKLERFMKAYGLKSPHYAVKASGYLLIFLCADKLDGKYIVSLSDNAVEWLEKTLDKNRNTPTMIFCHAPLEGSLAKVGELGDHAFAHPAGRIEKILKANDQVFLWGAGHTHTKPGSKNFKASQNFWNKQVHVVLSPDLTEKGGWINTLTLMPDYVILKTYDCDKKEWLKKYERKFKHKFSAKSEDDEKIKDDDEKDDDSKSEEDMSGIVVPGLDKANVRSSAWGPVIGTLYGGKFVDIKGIEGDWYIIDYEGKKGYVLKQSLLTNIGDKSKLEKVSGTGTVDVNGGYSLNVRDGAWGDKIGKLGDGDKVEIIGQEGGWYKIRFNGKTGFIYKAYVDASMNNAAKAVEKKAESAAAKDDIASSSSDDGKASDDKSSKEGIKGTKGFESNGLLNVSERAQRAPENGSAGNSYCGPTSIGMALDFYGINKSTKSIAAICIGPGGTCASKCLSTVKELGMSGSYMKEGASIDWLKDVTASGK
ncbi:MAG TPA: SH3 domain-containing protein, partial [Candidatus Wallbacteria bacterium]|nr:SH3 domain-containing protein [Candidatus Wallbacteria bacterium]